MSFDTILLPVFVQIALTFALLFTLGPVRVSSLRRGEVKLKDISLGQRAWPERITQVGNAFDNQFQLPVLFYTLVAMAIATRKVDLVLVGCAWVFVVSRVLHAAVYVTSNNINQRFMAYVIGAVALLAMWAWFAWRILAGT